MSEEIWKEIEFENYSISSKGRIRNNKTNKILKPYVHPNGYFYINIKPNGRSDGGKTFKIHRLVAIAFIDNPENKEQVNHKDGNKLNNDVTNLEWSSAKENVEHAINTGLTPPVKYGDEHGSSVLSEELIEEIRKQYIPKDRNFGLRALARKYGLKHNTLSNALSGINWKHLYK